MMMQVNTNANQMSQQTPSLSLVMPSVAPRYAWGGMQFSNSILEATSPEVATALNLVSTQGTSTNSMDEFVRALENMKQGRADAAESQVATASESTFSDIASSGSPRSVSEQSDYSPASPASTASGSGTGPGEKSSLGALGMPLSSLDPKAQDELRKQRKKERNRVAAMKCRRRKIEREQDLDGKVKILKSENSDLTAEIVRLRSQVYTLKQTVMEHISSGCNIFQG